jgi:hypothetical protein
MSEVEDDVRRYAEALTRAVRPVERAELDARRGQPRRLRAPLLTGIAATLCAVVVAGLVIAVPDHHHDASTSSVSTAAPASSSLPPLPCPAATLAVTGTGGERLHPDFLPAGFVHTEGNETNLGARGQLTYTPPGGGDPPRVQLLRYRTGDPLAQLSSSSSHHPVTVQGHTAVFSDGAPDPKFTSVAWNVAPGTALVVSGYKLSESVMLEVANAVRYDPGTTFTYPTNPRLHVTRADALALIAGPRRDRRAVLTSIGEVGAIAAPTGLLNRTSSIAPALSPATPVWVAWSTTEELKSKPPQRELLVIDAQSAARFQASASPAGVAALTDRNRPGCAPPFGVYTRSEIEFLRPAEMHSTQTATLTLLGRFLAAGSGTPSVVDCLLSTCDPNVPVWVLLATAPDSRFLDLERGPLGPPRTTTESGSWMMMAFDARTGAQSSAASDSGVSIGAGPPPAALRALVDLAPS